MSVKVFVQGAHGAVGQALLTSYLPAVQQAHDLEVVTLPEPVAQDAALQFQAMREADIVVLCLPDAVAPQMALCAEEANPDVRILDASAAHRCDPFWIYGLPEVLSASKSEAYRLISRAKRVANPGCFATGCVLLAKPLGPLLARQARQGAAANSAPRMAFQGITGFSAGGRKMQKSAEMPYLAQFGSDHRHLPEIELYGGVDPVLTTLVGDWYQGMQVQTTVPLEADEVEACLWAAYAGNPQVDIRIATAGARRVSAVECNGTDKVVLTVAKQPRWGTTVAATYDNLGTGSAGALARNLSWMLEGHPSRN